MPGKPKPKPKGRPKGKPKPKGSPRKRYDAPRTLPRPPAARRARPVPAIPKGALLQPGPVTGVAQPGRATAPGRARGHAASIAPTTDVGRHRIERMRRTPVVAFGLGVFEGAVIGRPYSLATGIGTADDRAFIDAAYIRSGRLHEFLQVMLEALPWGFVLAQLQWELEDVAWHDAATGKLEVARDAFVVARLDALDPRHLKAFLVDAKGRLVAVEWGDDVIPATQLVHVAWRSRYGNLCGESIFRGAVEPWEDWLDDKDARRRYVAQGGGGGKWICRVPVVVTDDDRVDAAATQELAQTMVDAMVNLESCDTCSLPNFPNRDMPDKYAYEVENKMPEDRSDLFASALGYDDEQALLGMGIVERAVGTADDGGRVAGRLARDNSLLPTVAAIDLMLHGGVNRGIFAPTMRANRGREVVVPQLRGPAPTKDRQRILQELFNRTASTRIQTRDGRLFEPGHLVDHERIVDELDAPLRPAETLTAEQPVGTIGDVGRPSNPEGSRSPESRSDEDKTEERNQ